MEITEGNVRVSERPVVTINDVPLERCDHDTIAQAMLRMLRRIAEQRKELEELKQ